MWGREPRFGSGCRCANGSRDCWRRPCMIKPMLLIVDDEKPTREGLRAVLEDRYDVYLAGDAGAAVELLEKEHLDVLLTDLSLSKEDGMKFNTMAKTLTTSTSCM